MSTPSESTLTTDFPGDSKSSTTATDNVGKEQHDVSKSTVEQDTAVNDTSLPGSLDAKIASEDHPAGTSDGSSPTINVVPGADLPVAGPETLSPQGAHDAEVWIPKGKDTRPHGTQTIDPKPQRPQPSKPKRGD